MAEIGFIGLGTMGGPMAGHLLHDDNDLWVYDIADDAMDVLAEDGANTVSDPSEVGQHAEVVFLSLPRPEHVETTILGEDGLISTLSSGNTIIDLSTSVPSLTNTIGEELAKEGISLLGAPVSGGEAAANQGNLSIMVGGDEGIFNEYKPLIQAFGEKVVHVGNKPGHGHAVKLLNNYLSFTSMVATSEAVALGEKAGLDIEEMLDVFNSSSGRNSATEIKFPDHVVPETYDRGFALGLTEKDIKLYMDFAKEYDMPVFVGAMITQVVTASRLQYGGQGDITEIYKYILSNATEPER